MRDPSGKRKPSPTPTRGYLCPPGLLNRPGSALRFPLSRVKCQLEQLLLHPGVCSGRSYLDLFFAQLTYSLVRDLSN